MRKEITEDQITQLLAGIPRAEEVDRLKAEIEHLHSAHQAACAGGDLLCAEIKRLRTGLHRVLLASQSHMSSKYECGLIARETLDYKP